MKTRLDENDPLAAEVEELNEHYKEMMPEARKALMEAARRFRKQFPLPRPVVRLRLVANRDDL